MVSSCLFVELLKFQQPKKILSQSFLGPTQNKISRLYIVSNEFRLDPIQEKISLADEKVVQLLKKCP